MIRIIALIVIAVIVLGAIKHGELDKLNYKEFKDYEGEEWALVFVFIIFIALFFIILLKR